MGNFGENLRAIRTERGLSQEALAQLLGTSKQVISRYENGQRSPKVNAAAKYARILGVSLTSLNGDDSPALPHPALLKVQLQSIPLLGETADDAQIELPGTADNSSVCDFAFRLKDESMQPRFLAGDIIFLRSQKEIPDGRIAAIRLNDEILLRRVYHLPDSMQLIAENPSFPPVILKNEDADIIGLAVRFSRSLVE